jgi:hypothetical protein
MRQTARCRRSNRDSAPRSDPSTFNVLGGLRRRPAAGLDAELQRAPGRYWCETARVGRRGDCNTTNGTGRRSLRLPARPAIARRGGRPRRPPNFLRSDVASTQPATPARLDERWDHASRPSRRRDRSVTSLRINGAPLGRRSPVLICEELLKVCRNLVVRHEQAVVVGHRDEVAVEEPVNGA